MYWYGLYNLIDISQHSSNKVWKLDGNFVAPICNKHNDNNYLTSLYTGVSNRLTFTYNTSSIWREYEISIAFTFNTTPIEYIIKEYDSGYYYNRYSFAFVVASTTEAVRYTLPTNSYWDKLYKYLGKGIFLRGNFKVIDNIQYDYSFNNNLYEYMINCNIIVNNKKYDTIIFANENNSYKQTKIICGSSLHQVTNIKMFVGNLTEIWDNPTSTFSSFLTQVVKDDIITFDKNDEFPPCFQFVIDNFMDKSVIPPTPAHQITTGFYQNTSTYNRIDKTDYLTKVRDIEGTFRSDVDVSHPVMRYQSEEMPDFNYAIIGELNSRCYYIDKVTYIAKGLWQLDMSIDVLMTYKDAIMNLKTFVTRNQYDYNTLIPDDRLPLQQGREITYEIIPNDLFGNSGSFLLQGLLLTPGNKIKEDPTTDDLLGTWVLRDKPNLIVDINNKSIPITFTSDEDTYLYFSVYDYRLIRYINNEFTNDIYNEDHYIDDVYKTITITSADISNSLVKMLYYWLTNNATKQEA